jgi:hypothetical protein
MFKNFVNIDKETDITLPHEVINILSILYKPIHLKYEKLV